MTVNNMRPTRRNEERITTHKFNEEVYGELDEDEIAFRFTPPNSADSKLFVMLTPTVGQRRKLLSFGKIDNNVDAEHAQEETISILKQLVVIPTPDEFEDIYNTLRLSKEEEFGDLFQKAMEAKKKK